MYLSAAAFHVCASVAFEGMSAGMNLRPRPKTILSVLVMEVWDVKSKMEVFCN